MGAQAFRVTQLNKGTAEDAYRIAVRAAVSEYGHQDGYNGTISTTDGFQVFTDKRPRLGTKAFSKWEAAKRDKMEKWGAAGCISLTPAELRKAKNLYEWSFLKGKRNISGFYFFGIAAI